jgi:hypothetical protein
MARLDVLVDLTVQSSVLVAVAQVIMDWDRPRTVVLVAFAATWSVNFMTFLAMKGSQDTAASLVSSRYLLVSVAKLVRDYGFVVLVLGGWVAVAPRTAVAPSTALPLNVALLLAYIANDAYPSMRPHHRGVVSLTPTPPHGPAATTERQPDETVVT